ncbi:hypothetical protein ABBQ38_013371 [Trebouxia sp. C0009 RCD-2024]
MSDIVGSAVLLPSQAPGLQIPLTFVGMPQTTSGCQASLRACVSALFQGNPEEGTHTKFGDWILFVKLTHAGLVPSISEVQ